MTTRPTLTATLVLIAISHVLAQATKPAEPARTQWSPAQLFKTWDKDGDGKLTAEEVPKPELFKMLDKNGDGSVTKEEIATMGKGGAAPGGAQGMGEASKWKGMGVSSGAPLPPAENFKPREHGEEAAKAGLKPEVLARLDVELQRHVAASNVAGVVALIHKAGERGYFETFGMADIEAGKPMSTNAIFRLMSMTKPVIALAALTLFDEGKFTLDEPISKHMPEWKEPKVLENGQLVTAKTAITPRMLMSHSSGLYYGSLEGAPAQEGEGVAAMAFRATHTPGTTLKEFSETLARQPLKFQPGEGYQYGHSIDILGCYLEAVADKPLDQVMKERLFFPLKMVDTDFWVPPEKTGRICQLYRQLTPGALEPGRDGAKLTDKPTLFLGGHGLCSTIGDYERFCRMILNRGELDGVRVLKPETVDLIFQNHLKTPKQKYGLGGVVNGEGSYGWGGADGTQFAIDRKNSFFVLFMVQTQNYKAPTYPAFLALANEAAGVIRGGAGWTGADGTGGLFKQRDKNNDGKLDREELPGAVFDRLDANKDCFVTGDEQKALWKNK